LDRGDFNMDVDAIEQRTADLAYIALDHRWSAHALAGLVVEIAAGTGVHGGREHEAGRKGEGHGGARDGHHAVLEGLTKDLKDVAGEFGKLVEEEQTVVGERDFAGARDHAATDEAGVGDGVVWGSEGSVGNETLVAIEDAGNRVNLGGFQSLFKAQGRQDGGEALGEHGLAGAGRPNHEDIVATGSGDFQSTLRYMLAANVAEVGLVFNGFVEEGSAVDDEGLGEDGAVGGGVEELAYFEERGDRIDVDAGDDGGLARVGSGNDEVVDTGGTGRDGDREHALNSTEGAVKAEFTYENEVRDVLDGEGAVRTKDADGDGEIEAGALFFEVGGSQINGDASGGKVEAGVLDGGTDAVTRFSNGRVGKSDGGKGFFLGFDAGEVDLYVDDVRVDTVHGGATSFEEHA
jgi:hypothetical protein